MNGHRVCTEPGRSVVVLKSPSYGAWAADHPASLPYGIHHLERHGFDLVWTDVRHRRPWNSRPVGRLEAATTPFVQAAALGPRIRRATAVLAMFESEGHGLAAWRAATRPRHPAPLTIVSCWLGELLRTMPDGRRRLYRRLYRHVDRVTVFSANQVPIVCEHLALPDERVSVVPFGIDTDDLSGLPTRDDGGVVAVGRDRGRDWPTLFDAVRGTGWRVTVATRPSQLGGLDVPAEVQVLGYVDRARYLELLAGATVVALTTHDLTYPTGQTVLLEAWALGKPVVVTSTPAMHDYLPDGAARPVPVGDVTAVRDAIRALLADPDQRVALGTTARATVQARFTSMHMWDAVARAMPTRR